MSKINNQVAILLQGAVLEALKKRDEEIRKEAQRELMATINKEINKESRFWETFEEGYNKIILALNKIKAEMEK